MTMAGLGLVNALDQYQQGVAWKQQQQEIARQERQRQISEEADRAASGVIEQSRAEWARNGAQGTYMPNDMTMFRAANARGVAFAKAGDWASFVKNEAAVQPMRIKTRANALQKFESDGIIEDLARTYFSTVGGGGRDVVGIERSEVKQFNADPSKPAENLLKVKFADGSSVDVSPQGLYREVKTSLIDPVQYAQREIELNMLRAKSAIETGGKVVVEQARGAEARKTEGIKAENARGLEGVKFEHTKQIEDIKSDKALGLAKVNTTAAQKRAETSAAAAIQGAKIRAGATLGAARISADAKGDTGGMKATKDWQEMARRHFGSISGGPFGSSRISDKATLDLATAAQLIYQANKGAGITESQALDMAAKKIGLSDRRNSMDDAPVDATED